MKIDTEYLIVGAFFIIYLIMLFIAYRSAKNEYENEKYY
jgi:hypothetical protein